MKRPNKFHSPAESADANRAIDPLLDQAGNPTRSLEAEVLSNLGPVCFPRFDLVETRDRYTILGDLPGLEEKDLDIEWMENTLTIIGERDREQGAAGARYHALERATGTFLRTFYLPKGVRVEHSRVTLNNGVLRVDLPKGRDADNGC